MSQFGAANDNTGSARGERRAALRRRVLFGGKIVHIEHGISFDCTIRDLSAAGAQVEATLADAPGAPALIVIRAAGLHEFAVAWRRGTRCGLRFLSSIDLSAPAIPARFLPLRRLWLEHMPR